METRKSEDCVDEVACVELEEAYRDLMKDECHLATLASLDRPWNAKLFIRKFDALSGKVTAAASDRQYRGKLLVAVARNTMKVCEAGWYFNEVGEQVTLPVSQAVEGDLCRNIEKNQPQTAQQPCVTVESKDCVDAAVDLVRQGLKPALLNFANEAMAGGGWRTGASAQEEDLFRRSDYHKLIDAAHYEGPDYPLQGKCCIYTPGVRYFRRGRENGYSFMDEPVSIATIACAAYVKPNTKGAGLAEEEEDGTLGKVRSVFNAAKKHGNDSLVLGAFGCGAFQNPPHAIANLMKQVCLEHADSFKTIVFPILQNDGRENLQPFQQVFRSLRPPQDRKSVAQMQSAKPNTIPADEEKPVVREEKADQLLTEENQQEDKPEGGLTNTAKTEAVAVQAANGASTKATLGECDFYSLEQLRESNIWRSLPIDPSKREAYLDDGSFTILFGMSKEEFAKLPSWKAQKLKKEHSLF